MKGVSNAVVIEKGNQAQSEIDIIVKQLKNANFAQNVLITTGKSI